RSSDLHVMPLLNLGDQAERCKAQAFLDRLTERALRMEGSCSGEHGVGQGKMRYLAHEECIAGVVARGKMRSRAAGQGMGVKIMPAIKKALDPLNILNPGKIFAVS